MAKGHVTFHTLPGNAVEFKQIFKAELRPAMAETAGFIQAGLLGESEKPLYLMMVLRFDSLESAAA